ncbi:LysR family transcriptional regulator [Dyella flagellata]|uniref:LysR family transcriptional regulator n=1 Tax=Dyella flagellata TaxID=1867833 RepID=A0ABQ5XCL9_9GAMM|nr:LysR family transcriptional regulator [Dyella flagellata]GLQ88275.1 LysR family transcriptional regulator [Dyella flagellata]
MDRLEAMSMLVAIADHGSFSAAGRALRVPLATLSRKISDLEAHLGTRLLVRTTRKLTLTDAGVAYVMAARRILDEVEGAEREAAGEFTTPKGELVVTAPVFFGRLHVLPVVTDFLALYAQINLRLILADRNVDLIEDHVDMAVRIGNLPDSTMVATQVGLMRTVTCASPTLLAGHGVPKQPDDLLTYPCVAVLTPTPVPSWRFRMPGSQAMRDVPILPRLAVTTPEAAVQAAIRGVGVTRLLHYQVADAIRDGTLQRILQRYEPEPVPVHLLHASRGQMPLKLRSFIDFAAPRLRESLVHLP